ncbi:MAG: ATP-binding cassette domain-containing protein [Chloroflexi bacterium]|nr:ATP-binding cassette domain-containing protein [Chloroflexota bacterium]
MSTSIELCNVSFRYSENHPWVLENVNLKIEEGESLALVGLNGAGKTTLIKLLTRLYDPTKGNILWNGVDIRHFEIESLRQRIGVIFQDYMKYDLTIQENIGLGSVERINDLDWIKQVADQAGVHELIDSMPNSYQTSLGFTFTDEAGMDLSGGQWQKLALARLFMRGDADFLVLDEPTSALDVQSESETYTRFTELMNGKTTLLISHRFSTVQMADKIAVLENGRITEFGSHKELVTSGGTYSRLFKCQAERYAQ